jgi:hypothetical protein
MPAVARISPIWKKQKLFVALFLLAAGSWFFFDGLVGYPRKNARYREWKSYVEEGRDGEWQRYAEQRGWKPNEWPDYVREHRLEGHLPQDVIGRDKIVGQYVFGALGVLLGTIVLIYWATQKNRVVRSDESAVHTPAGTCVPFRAITGLGKKRWETKGIAVVRYEIDGRKGQFILDDYKFETQPTRTILEEIETTLLARGGTSSTTPPV